MEVVRLQYSEPAALDDGYRGAALDLLAPWNDTRAQMQHRLSRWLARDRQTSPEAAAEEALALARWSGHIRSGEPPVNAALGLAWLYRYLDAHSWRGGGCMVLEDVHLCQEPGDGLDIAEAILERTVGLRPLLVVLTINTEALARDPALQAWAARLAHLGAVMLSVHRHGEEEMLELLQEGWRLEPALARRLAPDCAGRPGFAALLIRDLATRDLLSPTPAGDFRLSPEGEGEALPTQVGELLERRLAGAIRSAEEPEAAALAAAVVALCGAHPPLVVAREVHPEGLEMLLSTGIVRRRSARLSFEDPGLRMVALRMAQDRSDRTELHRRIADAWEKLAQLTGLDVDLEHGRHRWQAGQADRAVAPLLRAGRAALASGRPRVALSAAELAVRAADACGVTMARVEARQRLAEALLELDQPLVARDRVEQAWRIGGIDRLSRARLDVLGARAAIGLGELELAAELADRARGVFEATRDRQGLVEAAMAQGMRLRLEGRPAEAAECFAAVLSANRGHDLRAEVIGRAGLVECRALAGGLEEVREELPALMELARSSGDTRWMAQAHFAAGSVYLIGRRWEAAERSLLTARALASTLGADRLRLACERRLAELGRLRGDPVGAADALLRAARRAEQRGWSSVAALARVQRALLHITRRDSEEQATEEMEHAARLLAAHPRHWAWIYVSLFRAGTVAAQGDERAAHAWWSAALERGLARLLTPEPLVLLERLRDRLAEGPGAELRRLIQRQIERLSGLAAPAPGLPPGPGVGSRDAW
jgi:tetratricopeptide (TPR) repeat protein